MDYWKECIEEAFCEFNIKANQEQIDNIVESVKGAHENYGMYTGEEHIPNPSNSEVDELKAKIKSLEAAHERQLDGVARGVAQRRKVDVNDVSINVDGLVTYK